MTTATDRTRPISGPASKDPTVPVGVGPIGIAITADGRHAYVANNGDGTVSVIDTASLTTLATIAGFNGPVGVAITPSGARAYVTCAGSGTIEVIDTATDSVVGAPIAVGDSPFEVAITPDGARAYVANHGSATASVVDTAANTVLGAPIAVGNGPNAVAVSPDGRRVYISNQGSGTLSVIDTATNTVSATIPVGTNPIGVAVLPDGSRAYVANNADGTVNVIDTATDSVVGAPIAVATNPAGVASSPDGSRIWVVNYGSNSVSVIDTATNTVIVTFPVGAAPSRVALTPNGLSSYVSDNGANTVSVITALRAVSPNQGPTGGGTVVTITGVNLAGAGAVHFGSLPATIIGDIPDQVTVISPAGAGTVDITVTTPGGTSNPEPFYYIGAPLVTGIDPPCGPTTGATTAAITGCALSTAREVLFGSAPALPAAGDNRLTVTVPPQAAPGPVPVTVVTAGGAATALSYTYLDASTLTALNPPSGPASGGSPVTITGTGLATCAHVTLGGVPAAFTVISDTTVAATTPALAPGPVDLTITTGTVTVILPGAYTCLAAPTT
jgi:YVTN family beta-propeller protein